MPNFRRFGILGLALLVITMTGLSPVSPARGAAPVIGLFTDYGWDDPYVAQLKGSIVTIDPDARLLDITHNVSPFNVTEGAFLLDQCAEEFPAGTIFVAVVDPQVGTPRDPIMLLTAKGKYFIGPDNGLFSQVVDHEGFSKAWKLDKTQFFHLGAVSSTFHGRDIFGPIAAHLASGTDPERMGTPLKTIFSLPDREPSFAGGLISAQVQHIDRYGNVILNLAMGADLATKLKEGNVVKISIGKTSIAAPLVKTYADVEKGRLLLLYGAAGFLEISMNQGSAARQLKVEPGATVYLKP
jgi:S-adenosylmethionine hydrolase